MKIAYICADFGVPIFGHKGASIHVREMISAWRRLGHEVVVFSPNVGECSRVDDKINAAEIKPEGSFEPILRNPKTSKKLSGLKKRFRIELRYLLYNQTLYRKIKPIMKIERFDFIYERYSLLNYAGVALSRRFEIPHILEVNSLLCDEHETMYGLKMKYFAQKIEHLIMNESDRVIVVSNNLLEYVKNLGVPKKRILLVPNGVDPLKFKPNEADRKMIRDRLNLTGKIVIGFVGTFQPWHDIEALIQAVFSIYSKFSDFHLLIVGDGPRREALETRLQDSGFSSKVTLTGIIRHPDIPKYISAMDITVAPFVAMDNFYFSPIKLFEYMAVEKPVVATGIGQVNEIVTHNETGLLYEPGNVIQLKNILLELIANPSMRERLGKRARQWVIKNRTWDENARSILKAVNDCLMRI
jgi:glycosyltransferase involved in cell wall biosynthesis